MSVRTAWFCHCFSRIGRGSFMINKLGRNLEGSGLGEGETGGIEDAGSSADHGLATGGGGYIILNCVAWYYPFPLPPSPRDMLARLWLRRIDMI
jgi:hypothetical protein